MSKETRQPKRERARPQDQMLVVPSIMSPNRECKEGAKSNTLLHPLQKKKLDGQAPQMCNASLQSRARRLVQNSCGHHIFLCRSRRLLQALCSCTHRSGRPTTQGTGLGNQPQGTGSTHQA
eukprot:264473-Pelagomonas_calceolata.AAC.3